MTLEELWKMTKAELDKLNTKVDKIELKVNKMEPKVNQIDEIKDKVNKMEPKVNQIDGIIDKLGQIDEIRDKLDIMVNVNMAKILEHQIETRKELNDKIDKLLLQNNLEHKQFAYQIAQLEMKNGITRIG